MGPNESTERGEGKKRLDPESEERDHERRVESDRIRRERGLENRDHSGR
jgi:hypothetical protein